MLRKWDIRLESKQLTMEPFASSSAARSCLSSHNAWRKWVPVAVTIPLLFVVVGGGALDPVLPCSGLQHPFLPMLTTVAMLLASLTALGDWEWVWGKGEK